MPSKPAWTGGDGIRAPKCDMSRHEYKALAKTARGFDSHGETVRAVVCKHGQIVNWFEYAKDAHDYVQRRHEQDVRIVNPAALS